MVMIDVGDPKMAREMLCRLQFLADAQFSAFSGKESPYVQGLIDQIDQHRPLGPDGKHGSRHTPTCGCEDKTIERRAIFVTDVNTYYQIETSVWSNDTVTYRHRGREQYWHEWGEWDGGK